MCCRLQCVCMCVCVCTCVCVCVCVWCDVDAEAMNQGWYEEPCAWASMMVVSQSLDALTWFRSHIGTAALVLRGVKQESQDFPSLVSVVDFVSL